MNDYYQELSYGTFKIEGKFVGWVEVSKKRMDYTTGSGTSAKEKTALLTEALDVYTEEARQGLARRTSTASSSSTPASRVNDDPRRAVLAAPRQRQLRRPALAVLHRPGGRRAG